MTQSDLLSLLLAHDATTEQADDFIREAEWHMRDSAYGIYTWPVPNILAAFRHFLGGR